jgi:prevent-host-death family protein
VSIWQLQTAKARLSELLRAVREDGPQTISVRGKEEFVVVRKQEFDGRAVEGRTLYDVFRPIIGLGVDLEISPRVKDNRPNPFGDE